MRLKPRLKEENGAVLPLLAVVLLVLMGFAALGVDASAAYSERRQAQSAADASAMAAAVEYLTTDSPSGEDLIAVVTEYVGLNWSFRAPSADEWAACTDPSKPAEYSPVVDSYGNAITDCLSLKQVDGAPALLRVRLPDYAMPTSFASVIGFDFVSISAIATAELRYSERANVLPVSVPANPRVQECLGTPPNGQLPLDPVVCDGATSGVFGILNTPFFGAEEPHYTNSYPSAASTTCFDRTRSNEVAERASHSFALGLDHLITKHPDGAGALTPGQWEGASPQQPPAGGDGCQFEGSIPYILLLDTGNANNSQAINSGLIGGPGTASVANGSAIGRLRQPSSPGSSENRLVFDMASGDFDVDNVGLWEYVVSGCESVLTMAAGREKTLAMIECVNTGAPAFSADLLNSPRFALVPELNYSACGQANNCNYGNKWWAVRDLVPVYIQTTWFTCAQGGRECLFQPADWIPDPSDEDTYSQLLNPGEGTIGPCLISSGECRGGSAINPNRLSLNGVSAIVLNWNTLPEDARNQLGAFAPFEVFLHNNE